MLVFRQSSALYSRVGSSVVCLTARLTPSSGSLRLNRSTGRLFLHSQGLRGFAHSAPFPKRTHTCGALTSGDAGSRVVLVGWILPARRVKDVLFVPIKDSYGTTQLLVPRGEGEEDLFSVLSKVPPESSVLIQGQVRLRPEISRRPEPTGQIEVLVEKFTLLNAASRDLPFMPSDTKNLANDDLRSRYRYLDLRRPTLSNNLRKRSKVAHIVRTVLLEQDFIEVETPILLKSTPEGAREFLVPTRLSTSDSTRQTQEPQFYALTQSPQQPKQLLICSGGVDRYFQLAKCFRDEDGRKDRQPEFTQIDLEMAYVSWGEEYSDGTDKWRIGGREVREVVESMVKRIWLEVEGSSLPETFNVMTYEEAMSRFGSDKPDLRFGLEISDFAGFLSPSIQSELDSGGDTLECLVIRNSDDAAFVRAARKYQFESKNAVVERISVTENNRSTWLSNCKILSGFPRADQAEHSKIDEELRLGIGDIVWLSRRKRVLEGGSTTLGRVRLGIAELAQARGEYIPSTDPHFLWVTEFPLFTRADEDKEFIARGRWSSSHHPFTAPVWQDVEAMYAGRFGSVRGQHYDLVLNGIEIGGGSVRVHDPAMQEYIFSDILQLDANEQASFDHLLHALKCGAPPHGGIALGFDRLMAILCKTQSIRDVIAFPKTGSGTDLLFKSPAPVKKELLYQYGIQPR